MAKPPPDNLGKRQHELNTRTNDAFAKKVKFETVVNETEVSEVDKFFKIDLAAKCRNVDYIIDILRAGETLYAHRALKKCPWLFGDEYSHIISPEYLQDNIFPMTSMRVKRLLLKTMAMSIRTEERAETFYRYCLEIKMPDIALKCLLFTGEQFKLGLIQNKNHDIQRQKFSYIQSIIGKSFTLLEAYMKMLTNNQENTIFKFRYMYPVNNIKYLELLETYVKVDDCFTKNHFDKEFDHRLCDDIMKKYKDRVYAKPIFYLNRIPMDIVIRNLTADDSKTLIAAIFPSSVEAFWDSWFCSYLGKEFINLLPHSEVYGFIKKLFHDKFPNDQFEMHKYFYKQNYYNYMTDRQREEWALNQINSDKQILGVGNDYIWYRFLNFKDAFEEIKKYVFVTKESEKRAEMLATLVKSVRNNRDLDKLFVYYNKRHVNEPIRDKIYFLDDVILNQNVYEFDDACWESFYTLLLSVEIYTLPKSGPTIDYSIENYKVVTLFYYILHKKEMPPELMNFFLDEFFPHNEDGYGTFTIQHHFAKLSTEKHAYLYNYLYTFYSDKIKEYKNKPYTYLGKTKAQRYFKVIVKLVRVFNVSPDVYIRKPAPQKQRKTRIIKTNISDRQLLRELKRDKSLALEKLSIVKERLQDNRPIEVNNFLKKIKIYFKDDVRDSYLEMFTELVSNELGTRSVDACVKGIFKLGNEAVKINLMQKYTPNDTKIDYQKLDPQQLCIQRSICRYASNSLPPVPLDNMLPYMKGDYVHHCLHLFSIYITALPMSFSIKLVESVLDAPVSIQKHAIRLAFQCFSATSLKNVSKNIWEKTKNVSLRSVIYKSLFDRIVDKNETELREILISFTLDLHDDDEKEVFELVQNNSLPSDFLGEYKKATWKALREFKDKEPNIGRKTSVINGIRMNLNIMDQDFVRKIIDEHFDLIFEKNKLELNYSQEDIASLYVEKFNLIVEYIVACAADIDDFECIVYIERLAENVVTSCINMWNEQRSDKHIYQRCCWEFIRDLNTVNMEYYPYAESLIPVYEKILDVLQGALPVHELYMQKWEIQLVIANRRAIKKHRENFGKDNKKEIVTEAAIDFGRELGRLVSEYVVNKMYFTSVSEQIKAFITKRIEEILNVIFSLSSYPPHYIAVAFTSVAVGLVNFKLAEVYILALELLPTKITDDEHIRDKNKFVIDSALKFSDPEVQYAAHQKLILLK